MSTISLWDENDLGRKIEELLAGVKFKADHHFGRLFVTPYQLAIMFKNSFPEDSKRMGYQIGEEGSGGQYSLASYLARQFSRKLEREELPNIEAGFQSNIRLSKVTLADSDGPVTSTATNSQCDLSFFRLRSVNC